ncbi:MAG: CARDB domain-containing protein [Saprospiraceae bacterium]
MDKKKLVLISSLVLLLFAACKKDRNNCEAIYLPDLAVDSVSAFTSQLSSSISINLAIINIPGSDDSCQTQVAGITHTGLTAFYREEPNMPWEEVQLNDGSGGFVSMLLITEPKIWAGQKSESTIAFDINTVGYYKFSVIADALMEVDERDETNNGGFQRPSSRRELDDVPAELLIHVAETPGKQTATKSSPIIVCQ